MNPNVRPGQLYYYDGVPAWMIRIAQPSRFADVQLTLEFQRFLLPEAGLLACILSLHDIPDQPFFAHRVFDISDPAVARYLADSARRGVWVVEIRSGGEDREVLRIAHLKGSGFRAARTKATGHNERLGRALDGEKALAGFLDTFDPAASENGWQAGWAAVERKYKLRRT